MPTINCSTLLLGKWGAQAAVAGSCGQDEIDGWAGLKSDDLTTNR